MLKFTRRTEYALMAIRYMQTKRDKSVTSTKEISSKIDIPFQILSKVLQYLAKMNIILSILGPNGGYKIKDNLLHLNLWEFLDMMEGPLGITDCLTDSECDQIDRCNIKTPMNQINNKMKTIFSKMKLVDVL